MFDDISNLIINELLEQMNEITNKLDLHNKEITFIENYLINKTDPAMSHELAMHRYNVGQLTNELSELNLEYKSWK